MHTIREKVKAILKKDAERIADFVEDIYGLYPDEVGKMVEEMYLGCHIRDEKMYDKAVSYFVNHDGTKGAKWTVDDIVNKSGINFDKKEYTDLDYAYVVNMMYSDYGNKIKDPELLLDMAVQYLEDEDYPGEASERAYKNAKKRIRYYETEEKRD